MLREISYQQVAGYRSRVEREGVSLKNAQGTRWFSIEGVDGFCAFLPVRRDGSKVRIKGFWVAPEFRGMGTGTRAFEELIRLLRAEKGIEVVESISRKVRFYEKQGFKKVRRMPSATTEKWRFEKWL